MGLQNQHLASFDELIAPLEEAVGEYLTGPGRTACQQAFAREPVAFAMCVDKFARKLAGPRPYVRGIGLLPHIVRQELDAIAERLRSASPPPPPPCPECFVAAKHGHSEDCSRRARAA